MKYMFLTLSLFISGNLSAQLTFESTIANIKVDLPIRPTEQLDTIRTDYGLIPRYSLLCKSIDHGRNLLYTVEILDTEDVEPELDFEKLRAHYISRKQLASEHFSFELVRESDQDIPDPYKLELVFSDKNGFLIFSRIFQKDMKFYIVETLRYKSQFKVGSKLNKASREFFDSFEFTN